MNKTTDKRRRSNYLPFGLMAGWAIGILIYGVTWYLPAMVLGASFGLTVGIALDVISSRRE